MRREKEIHERTTPNVPWNPTPLQAHHMQMWNEAQSKMPTEAAAAAMEIPKRTRLSDAITMQMKKSEEWMAQSKEMTPLEAAVMKFLETTATALPPPPAQALPPEPRMSIDDRITQLNDLLARGLLTPQTHLALVTKALALD